MTPPARRWFLGATAALAFGVASPALACSCRDDARTQLEEADALFVARAEGTWSAKLISVPGFGPGMTRFRVHRTVKGKTGKIVYVVHPRGLPTMCGVRFFPGQTYVVAAYRDEKGRLETLSCGVNMHPLEDYLRAAAGRPPRRSPNPPPPSPGPR